MKSFLLVLIACVSLTGGLCSAQDMPLLASGDLSGGTIVKVDFYSGKALFGYIDGGAELYLEYKFKKLGREEILYSGERFVVEMYEMEGVDEAYGIFSVQRFKCVPVDSLSPNTCLSKYQLQAVLGHCYISIVNESGSLAARKASVEIFQAYRGKIKPEPLELPPIFRNAEVAPYLRNLIVAFGQFGVQNGYSEWDHFFQNTPRFVLTLLPIEQGSDRLTIAHLRFPSNDECDKFCRLAGFIEPPSGSLQKRESEGMIRYARRLEKRELLFAESTPAFQDAETFVRLMSK